jgi:type IV secretory pathway VirB3-like protein
MLYRHWLFSFTESCWRLGVYFLRSNSGLRCLFGITYSCATNPFLCLGTMFLISSHITTAKLVFVPLWSFGRLSSLVRSHTYRIPTAWHILLVNNNDHTIWILQFFLSFARWRVNSCSPHAFYKIYMRHAWCFSHQQPHRLHDMLITNFLSLWLAW